MTLLTVLLSLRPKRARTILVSRGSVDSRKRATVRHRAGGEACDGHPIGRAGDVISHPYGISDPCLYVVGLLRVDVAGLLFALFVDGRDLAPSVAGSANRLLVL